MENNFFKYAVMGDKVETKGGTELVFLRMDYYENDPQCAVFCDKWGKVYYTKPDGTSINGEEKDNIYLSWVENDFVDQEEFNHKNIEDEFFCIPTK